MQGGDDHRILYPSKEDILQIHKDIIEEDDDAHSGILNEGYIEYTLNCIEHGHFGEVPETIHEKAVTLLRLLAANHSFADGNKRTALNTTWTFYALNGYYFDYGEEIKAILKLFAVMERMVDQGEAIDYFGEITYTSSDERTPSVVIDLIHFTRWHDSLISRFEEFTETYSNIDDLTKEEREEMEQVLFEELLPERNRLTKESIELRDEHRDNLPQEFIDLADQLEEGMKETVELIEEELKKLEDT